MIGLKPHEVIVFRYQDGYPYWSIIARTTAGLRVVHRCTRMKLSDVSFVVHKRLARYHAYAKGRPRYSFSQSNGTVPDDFVRITFKPDAGDLFFRIADTGQRVDFAEEVIFKEREVWAKLTK